MTRIWERGEQQIPMSLVDLQSVSGVNYDLFGSAWGVLTLC